MLRLSRRNCAIVLSGGLGRGDETMGLARRLRHNPWIAAAASWRMQRFQSRYCRYVDASGRRSEPSRPSFTRLGERVLEGLDLEP